MGEGGEGGAGAEGGAGGPAPVPYARFQEVTQQKAALQAERDAALSDRTAVLKRAEAAEAEAKTLKDGHAALSQELGGLRERVSLMSAGLSDDEGIDVARTLYGRVPEDQRPKGGLSEWVSTHRSDPAKAPRALQPYIGAQRAGEPPPRQPRSDPPAGGDVTTEQLKQARERYERSRDPSDGAALAKLLEGLKQK